MKTSVELDKKKVELARKLTHVSTLKELLDKSLDAFISKARKHALAEMLGTEFFEGDLKTMRKNRGPSR